ncbi:unnamed protein product [Cylindrotheca closterium]|uniref:Uncharacterized protein n=1 Tax=Cylindrotheca closterium TaxID=2856 RepID=A0AAD2GDK3_9STRA|nr:unnamed protein product [Cylindrotheca closterium]
MGKGKGRGSAKCTFYHDIQQELSRKETIRRQPVKKTPSQRPRLTTGLGTLRNLIRERTSYEHHEWIQQRRRAGYIPQKPETVANSGIEDMAPAELLGTTILSPSERKRFFENSTVSSLEIMTLKVLGEYLVDYLNAMGIEQLHGALSLLPSETLAALSVLISYNTGVDNNLAYVLGNHSHVTCLSLRATKIDDSFNDDGLLSLLPEVEDSSSELQSSWEDLDGNDDGETMMANIQFDGSTSRLQRLELVECPSITVDGLLAFLEKQPFIKRLSIAGCFNREDKGEKLLQRLPQLLPSLESLDLRRCSWVCQSSIHTLANTYERNQNGSPDIHYQDGQIDGGQEAW